MTNEILKSPKYYTHIKREKKQNIINERAQIKCVRLTKTKQQQDNEKSKQNQIKSTTQQKEKTKTQRNVNTGTEREKINQVKRRNTIFNHCVCAVSVCVRGCV